MPHLMQKRTVFLLSQAANLCGHRFRHPYAHSCPQFFHLLTYEGGSWACNPLTFVLGPNCVLRYRPTQPAQRINSMIACSIEQTVLQRLCLGARLNRSTQNCPSLRIQYHPEPLPTFPHVAHVS